MTAKLLISSAGLTPQENALGARRVFFIAFLGWGEQVAMRKRVTYFACEALCADASCRSASRPKQLLA